MKKILLTGASGFIGRNILEQLGNKYNFFHPGRQELDLTEVKKVRSYLVANNFDLVVHAAGAGVSREQAGAPGLLEQNKNMFLSLAENSNLFGRLIFLGSGAEYGKQRPIIKANESDFGKIIPEDEYGRAKYFASEYIASRKNIINLRLFGVFGPHEDFKTRFISNAICRALYGLPIVIRQNTVFEYVYIKDFLKILEYFVNQQPQEKFYNISSGQPVELLKLAEIVKKAVGDTVEIKINNPGLGREYTADNSRLMQELIDFKFKPFDESITELTEWYKEHLASVNPRELDFEM